MKLFPTVFQLFVNESGRLRTDASVRSFRSVCASLQAAHPSFSIRQFKRDHLTEFCLAGDPAPNTVKHRRSVLMTVFEWAHFKDLTVRNEAAGLKFSVQPAHHGVRQGNWLSEQEIASVIQACPEDFVGRRDRMILLFGFFMGLRLGTLSQLEWSNLSPDYTVLSVTVKGNKPTRKGVPPQLVTELHHWALEKPESAVALFPAIRSIGFYTRAPEPDWNVPLRRAGIGTAVRRAGARAGIKLTPHDMRRTLGGVMEQQGYQLPDIQRALDHSNVGTTSTYLDKNPLKIERATGGLTIEI